MHLRPKTGAADASDPSDRHAQGHASERAIRTALGVVVVFMVVEFTSSFVAHSLALLADSFHLLTDVASLSLALIAIRLSRRPPSAQMTFGLRRAEVVAAALNGLVLLIAATVVAIGAVLRLLTPLAVHGGEVIVIAAVGVVVNVGAAWLLAPEAHATLNHRAVFAHVVTDVAASAAVLVGGAVVFATHWPRADALASLAVVALIVFTAVRLVVASGRVLLEGAPRTVDLSHVRAHLLSEPDVIDVHDLHAWVVSSDLPAISAHVVVDPACFTADRAPETLDRLQACLVGHFDVAHTTLQLELPGHADHESELH